MKKLVIGIVGEKGGGKEAFTQLLEEIMEESVGHHRSSDVLGGTLSAWGIKPTRANYTKLAVAMDQTFGEGTLTQAVKRRIIQAQELIVAFDGIRWLSDLEMLRSLENSKLVYITADARVRWERTVSRGEKADENKATFEQFLAEEVSETERYIPIIGQQADVKIENNGSWKDFKDAVNAFCETLVS